MVVRLLFSSDGTNQQSSSLSAHYATDIILKFSNRSINSIYKFTIPSFLNSKENRSNREKTNESTRINSAFFSFFFSLLLRTRKRMEFKIWKFSRWNIFQFEKLFRSKNSEQGSWPSLTLCRRIPQDKVKTKRRGII